ncbi:hypothetical protein GUITHDRAFT_118203 [Guillardia theta CCMP2712]|uniref:Uncharacterized protein n=1 Tax=Guillardia theta (strain CCMP2712) TaxID=905079 RepID=L1IH85_GUITC|nr:hypothetical protein GUITHDRAFT_118203 [Guillardia theta CCMP2712]EKX35603.1 hypothetical protein GUITHDRAFT_118203 [Guillardia theta CCMP2712]|eukprot:XP_005822583.1 hypothetical protein GUITHDRAFT_118203 [Guillardia theta CCMP2712]
MTLLHELFKQRVKMSDTGAEDREDGQGSSKGKHDNTGRQGTGGGQSTKATEHEKTEEGEGETRAKGEEEDAAHDQVTERKLEGYLLTLSKTLLEHEEEEMTEHAR